MLMLPFSEHAYYEEECNSDTPAQNTSYFTIFLPPVIFPHSSDHFTSLPHKYSKALSPLGRWTWDLFSWLLAWLPCEQILSLLQTSPSRFDLLHVRQMKLVWQQFLGYDIKSTNKIKNRKTTSKCVKGHNQQWEKMQIKTIKRYHLTLIRIVVVKNQNNKYWQGCEETWVLLHS